ncbi:MCE family protein [Mycobacterium sp. CVI_P3]|uniref:MCE family protein n=1 Tax=Mycobacterium pinniadriaticum TaxID=2994102 RepID=A0ABT3SF42_9MYCO|nr:MCE family protein [Mycobacterium pinniadriaticum]MCX2931791.1 MCE family protein [Mycobacterium pinniadriaticum]MCX2938134.1 MCE family protein [Mycobacterium pinniadriaticum]
MRGSFVERNPFVVGAVGIVLTGAIAVTALQYDKLPFINRVNHYSAYFAEAGGLRSGAAVQVAGYRVGEVSSVDLDGSRVLVRFDVDDGVRLGEYTEANIRTKSLLGSKVLEITPRGDGDLTATIPVERTRAPYQLPDALGDLSATISGLDTDSVSAALATLADTFQDTPPDLKLAVQGVARFAETLDARDGALRNLLSNTSKVTAVLSERADEVAKLIANSDALLSELRTQSTALEQISGNLSFLAQQLSGFISDNKTQLRPALDKLNDVLSMVDNRKAGLQQAIKYLNQYAMSLGESVASGPFFKAYIVNLLPGQFVQPFIDAAFSDLGLDPNVLLPSQRTDPQTGQPATPPLPMPYPRTGQGGEPHLSLPEAITGNPADPRYPYRQPLAAPPPGGPPPGPPAPPPGQQPALQPPPSSASEPAGDGLPHAAGPSTAEGGQ